ncbi:MAG: hypothetical protein K0A99_12390 [Desulfoarculaceae bacterium]|nr:hypothetical protein [Desulfoarculaceae bacterium]
MKQHDIMPDGCNIGLGDTGADSKSSRVSTNLPFVENDGMMKNPKLSRCYFDHLEKSGEYQCAEEQDCSRPHEMMVCLIFFSCFFARK